MGHIDSCLDNTRKEMYEYHVKKHQLCSDQVFNCFYAAAAKNITVYYWNTLVYFNWVFIPFPQNVRWFLTYLFLHFFLPFPFFFLFLIGFQYSSPINQTEPYVQLHPTRKFEELLLERGRIVSPRLPSMKESLSRRIIEQILYGAELNMVFGKAQILCFLWILISEKIL